MGLLSIVEDLFKPAVQLIDDVHTSTEEKLQLRNELAKIEQSVSLKLIDLQSKVVESQTSILVAEAKGESWIQRSWRPILMLLFAGLIGAFWFGYIPPNITQDMPPALDRVFDIIQMGIGGYIGGRSVEKTAKIIKGS